jgi:hypothetical protein
MINKIKSFNAIILLFLFVGTPLISFASSVTLKNEDLANVEIFIQKGEGSVVTSNNDIKYLLKPKEEKKLDINKDDIANYDTFSIIGKVAMPSMYNRCKNLRVDHNYKVIFAGTKAGGVFCYYETLDPMEKAEQFR